MPSACTDLQEMVLFVSKPFPTGCEFELIHVRLLKLFAV